MLTVSLKPTRSVKHNLLKKRALKIFAIHGPMNAPAWAVLANFFPIRAAYTYLLRLHRFGLLDRTRDEHGLILYTLSDRGKERLVWLNIQATKSLVSEVTYAG